MRISPSLKRGFTQWFIFKAPTSTPRPNTRAESILQTVSGAPATHTVRDSLLSTSTRSTEQHHRPVLFYGGSSPCWKPTQIPRDKVALSHIPLSLAQPNWCSIFHLFPLTATHRQHTQHLPCASPKTRRDQGHLLLRCHHQPHPSGHSSKVLPGGWDIEQRNPQQSWERQSECRDPLNTQGASTAPTYKAGTEAPASPEPPTSPNLAPRPEPQRATPQQPAQPTTMKAPGPSPAFYTDSRSRDGRHRRVRQQDGGGGRGGSGPGAVGAGLGAAAPGPCEGPAWVLGPSRWGGWGAGCGPRGHQGFPPPVLFYGVWERDRGRFGLLTGCPGLQVRCLQGAVPRLPEGQRPA